MLTFLLCSYQAEFSHFFQNDLFMLIANIYNLLACFCSLQPKLLFQQCRLLRVTDILNRIFPIIFLQLLLLEDDQKFIVEALSEHVHVFLGFNSPKLRLLLTRFRSFNAPRLVPFHIYFLLLSEVLGLVDSWGLGLSHLILFSIITRHLYRLMWRIQATLKPISDRTSHWLRSVWRRLRSHRLSIVGVSHWGGRGCDSQLVHYVWVHFSFAFHFIKSFINLSFLNNCFFLHFSSLIEDLFFLILDSLCFQVVLFDFDLNLFLVIFILSLNSFNGPHPVHSFQSFLFLLDNKFSLLFFHCLVYFQVLFVPFLLNLMLSCLLSHLHSYLYVFSIFALLFELSFLLNSFLLLLDFKKPESFFCLLFLN